MAGFKEPEEIDWAAVEFIKIAVKSLIPPEQTTLPDVDVLERKIEAMLGSLEIIITLGLNKRVNEIALQRIKDREAQ